MASESFQRRNLDSPDETRTFEHGKAEVVTLGDFSASRLLFEPGWRWSENVKPIAGTDSCQVLHTGYHVSGRLHVRLDDGTEEEYGPGDAYVIPPGHDAWVVGDEPVVMVDMSSHTAERYAKE
jgi:mannose-6-phosphate isomerase-like protein (cupin superfamily)